jgi:hypothetical protein
VSLSLCRSAFGVSLCDRSELVSLWIQSESSLRQCVSEYASWSSESVLVSESVQCSSDSRIQEAISTSVKMFSVIVMCADVNRHSE